MNRQHLGLLLIAFGALLFSLQTFVGLQIAGEDGYYTINGQVLDNGGSLELSTGSMSLVYHDSRVASTVGGNIIDNPSFEDGATAPDFWQPVTGGALIGTNATYAEHIWDSVDSNSGVRSGKVVMYQVPTDTTTYANIYWRQRISATKLKDNTTYTIKLACKGGGATLRIDLLTASDVALLKRFNYGLPLTSVWIIIEKEFTISSLEFESGYTWSDIDHVDVSTEISGTLGTTYDPPKTLSVDDYELYELAESVAITSVDVTLNGISTSLTKTTEWTGSVNLAVGTYNLVSTTTYSDTTTYQLSGTVTITAPTIPVGTIAGAITDANLNPIDGATVTVDGITLVTDTQGLYSIDVAPGTYSVGVSKTGWVGQYQSATVSSGVTTTVDFQLPATQPEEDYSSITLGLGIALIATGSIVFITAKKK